MAIPVQGERFEYKDYPCVVLFMPMAYRCGYVGIPKDMKVDVDSVDCHGGITYCSTELYHQTDADVMWIGFDCGHCFDGFDLEKADEYYKDSKEAKKLLQTMREYHQMINAKHEFRTLEYVKEECKKIVEQIIELRKED